jgi:HEAT repeat protein
MKSLSKIISSALVLLIINPLSCFSSKLLSPPGIKEISYEIDLENDPSVFDIIAGLKNPLIDEQQKAIADLKAVEDEIDFTNPAVESGLLEVMEKGDGYPRQAVAECLAHARKMSPAMIQGLVKLFKTDTNGYVQKAAAETLYMYKYTDPLISETFLDLLVTGRPYQREYSALGLGQANEITPAITKALLTAIAEDTNSFVREAAAKSMIRADLADLEVQNSLLRSLSVEENEHVCKKIARCLGKTGVPTPAIAKGLIDLMLSTRGPRARQEAAISLGKAKEITHAIANALLAALNDGNPYVRRAAEESLAGADMATLRDAFCASSPLEIGRALETAMCM